MRVEFRNGELVPAGADDEGQVLTCAVAGDRCRGLCTVNHTTGEILDPDCFR